MGEKDPVRMLVACLCATLVPRPEPRLGLSALSYSGVHKVEAPKPYRTKGWGVEREIGTRLPTLQPQGMRRPRERGGETERERGQSDEVRLVPNVGGAAAHPMEREEEDASCSLCKLDGLSVGPRYQEFRALFTLVWYISYDIEPLGL